MVPKEQLSLLWRVWCELRETMWKTNPWNESAAHSRTLSRVCKGQKSGRKACEFLSIHRSHQVNLAGCTQAHSEDHTGRGSLTPSAFFCGSPASSSVYPTLQDKVFRLWNTRPSKAVCVIYRTPVHCVASKELIPMGDTYGRPDCHSVNCLANVCPKPSFNLLLRK